MAFGGGFFGSGESNTESLTQGAETGQQVEDQGQAFSVSNIETGKKSNIEINATTTDFGAVGGSLELVDNVFEGAVGVVDDSIRASGEATERAINSSDDARRDALEFGAGALVEVASAQADAFDASRQLVSESQEQAFTFGAGAFEAAIDESRAAREDAFDVVSDNTQSAVSAIGDFSAAAIDGFLSASKSESAQLSDNVIGLAKIGLVVFGLVAAAGVLR